MEDTTTYNTEQRNCIQAEANNKPKGVNVDFDHVLSAAGEIGVYQILLFISTYPFYLFGVCAYYSQLFITEVSPNHWCWIPELQNLTEIERRNLAIPPDSTRFGYSRCESYVANWTEVLISGEKPNETWGVTPCQNGWEFNKSEIPYPTISSEMGWVCDRNDYQATAQAICFIGSIVGGFFIGWVADRYGRLPATVVSNLIGCVAGIFSIYARNFIEFSICRFFVGISNDNCMMMVYLIVIEYVAPKYRTLFANLPFALFYSFNATVLPWVALACGHWKTISIVTSVPMAFALLAPYIIPESPRWLLSKGRTEETIQKLKTIGRINKKPISPDLIENFKYCLTFENIEKSRSTIDLLKKSKLRMMFICISLQYMCCMLIFDALVRTIGQLEFDFFMSFSILSLTEFPSIAIASFIMDPCGRKFLTIIVMLCVCAFSFLTPFIGGGLLSVMCLALARFFANIGCNVAMQWSAEILPTSVRGSGLSIIHTCGYVASILSPVIVYLGNYVYWLPLLLVGCIAAFGGIVSSALPETARKDLPQTFEDAEDLARNSAMWDIPFLRKTDGKTGQTGISPSN